MLRVLRPTLSGTNSLLRRNGWVVKVGGKVWPGSDTLRIRFLPYHVLPTILEHRPVRNSVLLEPCFELGLPLGVEADAPTGGQENRVLNPLDLSAVFDVPAHELLGPLRGDYVEWNTGARQVLLEPFLIIGIAVGNAFRQRLRFRFHRMIATAKCNQEHEKCSDVSQVDNPDASTSANVKRLCNFASQLVCTTITAETTPQACSGSSAERQSRLRN